MCVIVTGSFLQPSLSWKSTEAINLWQSGPAAASEQCVCPSSTVKAAELQLVPSYCSVADDLISGLWVILDWSVLSLPAVEVSDLLQRCRNSWC